MGHARFRRPRHRLFRQGPAQGPLRRHDARQFPHDDGHLLLFVHRGRAARREDDAERRLDGDALLLRRREGHAALQRDGRGEGRARGERALYGRGSRQEGTSASMRSPPDRSRRWPLAASAISATSSNGTSTIRRCAATSRSRKSATPRCFCCPISASAVTGECLHVDAGYHIVGMKAEDAPDIDVAKPE